MSLSASACCTQLHHPHRNYNEDLMLLRLCLCREPPAVLCVCERQTPEPILRILPGGHVWKRLMLNRWHSRCGVDSLSALQIKFKCDLNKLRMQETNMLCEYKASFCNAPGATLYQHCTESAKCDISPIEFEVINSWYDEFIISCSLKCPTWGWVCSNEVIFSFCFAAWWQTLWEPRPSEAPNAPAPGPSVDIQH